MSFGKIMGAALITCIQLSLHAQESSITLRKANGHPMQYYLSLPSGWSSSKKYPVVVVLEAAEKEYKKNLERFITARQSMPFILVAPIHTANGNQGRRDPNLFPYATETWDYIDKVGDCNFNDEGVRQIINDVLKEYGDGKQVYMTGFEAGTHLLWSFVFTHPEYLKAVAPVAGNYRGRCVDVNGLSNNPNPTLPIMGFAGDKDEAFGPSAMLFAQWKEARDLALKKGFKNIGETILPGVGHEPVPKDVLNYFNRLQSGN